MYSHSRSYKREFRHVKVAPHPYTGERNPLTVCIATLFQWNYAAAGEPPRFGLGAITASDRMITTPDVKYEPQQQKIAYFGKSMILVAGDIGIHSLAIEETAKQVGTRTVSPHDLALIYGRAIQGISRRHAENEILAPLGLNTDTFLAQQKDYSESFVSMVTSQLQNRRPIDIEALVVGSDGENAHIYSVDSYGGDISLDAVGFGAIGIGAWHAKSRLMQAGHTSSRVLANTLAAIYAAKKNAEIAPGVGDTTDFNIVLKDAIFPIWDRVKPELETLYSKYTNEAAVMSERLIAELQEFINAPQQAEQNDQAGQGPTGENAQVDGRASEDAPETSRGDEAGEEGKSTQEAAQ